VKREPSAAKKPEWGADAVLDGYAEWIEGALRKEIGEGDLLIWLGDHRWLVIGTEGAPDLFMVEINRAEVLKP